MFLVRTDPRNANRNSLTVSAQSDNLKGYQVLHSDRRFSEISF